MAVEFTKVRRYSFEITSLLVFSILWLASVQTAFYFLQSSSAATVNRSITGMFRNSENTLNFAQVAISMSELDRMGIITCPTVDRLSPPKTRILDLRFRGHCESNPVFLSGVKVTEHLTSANGETWSVNYVAANPDLFNPLLWTVRIFGMIVFILLAFLYRIKSIKGLELYAVQVKFDQHLTDVARKLSHDIRSPLSALALLAKVENFGLKEKELIKSIAHRVERIAEDLLDENRKSNEIHQTVGSERSEDFRTDVSENVVKVSAEHILLALRDLISEKRLRLTSSRSMSLQIFENIESGCLIEAEQTQLVRIISNLIDNSFESIPSDGFVSVELETENQNLRITVRDSGKGIPSDILQDLGKKNVTFGKIKGNGTALYEASKILQSWNASLQINSKLGQGTTIVINFKISNFP